MTFDTLVATVATRCNLTSTTAITRIGETINEKYKEVLSDAGIEYAVRSTQLGTATIGSQYMTFNDVIKILAIYDNQAQLLVSLTSSGTTATGTSTTPHGYGVGTQLQVSGATPSAYNGVYILTAVPSTTTFQYTFAGGTSPATGTITTGLLNARNVLNEVSFDELRNQLVGVEPPQEWAVSTVGATAITILMDCVASSQFTLSADVLTTVGDMSGADVPLISDMFQNMLIYAAQAVEMLKMEKPGLAKEFNDRYERRKNQYVYQLAISPYKKLRQGQDYYPNGPYSNGV